MARRENALETRGFAEMQVGRSSQLERAVFRAVGVFELLEQRAVRRRLHLGGRAPRHCHTATSAAAGCCGEAGNCHRAVETRGILFKLQRTVGLDRHRPIGRIEPKPHLDAVVADLACRKAITVPLAGSRKAALALRRPEQRAQLTSEPKSLKAKTRAARAISQNDARVFDGDLVDQKLVGIESDANRRQFGGAIGCRPRDAELRGADSAAHKRSQRELGVDHLDLDLRLRRAAKLDTAQHHARRWKQTHIDRAADANRLTGKARCLAFERGAILRPVDKMRTDQRR